MPADILDAEILAAEPNIDELILVLPFPAWQPKPPSLAMRLLDAANNSRLLHNPVVRVLTFFGDQLIIVFFALLTTQLRLRKAKELTRMINLEIAHLRRMLEENRGYIEGS